MSPEANGDQAARVRGRMGAYALHARYDSREVTEPARKAFLDRFEREVDPEGKLPETERLRRAEYAKRAYFTGLALRSARVRSKRQRQRSTTPSPLRGSIGPLKDSSRRDE